MDWNRDGNISPCGLTVKAAPNYQMGGAASSELGRYYKYRNAGIHGQTGPPFQGADADATSTPGLTRAFGRMYLAYRTSTGAIKLFYTNHDFKTGCTNLWEGCATWSSYTVATNSDAAGPVIATYTSGGTEYLILVLKNSGNLWYYKINSSNQLVAYGAVPGATGVRYEFDLTQHGSGLMLLYRRGAAAQYGTVYANTYGASGWNSSATQYEGGQPLQVWSVAGLAASPWGTFGVFSDFQASPYKHNLFWMIYAGGNTWSRILYTDMEIHDISSAQAPKRVGIAWRPDAMLMLGGRFYLAYNDMGKDAANNVGWIIMDMTDGGYGLGWIGKTGYENEWHDTAGGLALHGWQPTYTEEALRLSCVWDRSPTDKPLEFRPFADGIANVNLKDSNDFQVMERGTCASLHGCTNVLCTGSGGGNICIGGAEGEQQCQGHR